MTTVAYVVRYKKDKQVVGLLCAPSLGQLFWLIDEVADPYECEFTKMPMYGGILWDDSKRSPVVPVKQPKNPDDYNRLSLRNATPSETWAGRIDDSETLHWRDGEKIWGNHDVYTCPGKML